MNKANQYVMTLFFIVSSACISAQEPFAIVVNKANPVEKLSRSEVIDLFMGKYVAFPNDKKALPVELEGDHQVKIAFYRYLVDMPLSSVNAYWSRLRFTGRKRVTIFKNNQQELIDYIQENEEAIGYVPETSITKDLKVVYILNE